MLRTYKAFSNKILHTFWLLLHCNNCIIWFPHLNGQSLWICFGCLYFSQAPTSYMAPSLGHHESCPPWHWTTCLWHEILSHASQFLWIFH
jgi:hypothetical protein